MVRRVALSPTEAGLTGRMRSGLIAAALYLASAGLGLGAQEAPPPPAAEASPKGVEAVDPSLSPECRVPGSKLYTLAKLTAVKTALKEKHPLHVLSVGSSSAGLGSSSSYPVRLESALERSLPNVQIEVESRGLSGEIASGAGDTLRTMIAETEPDLVVWQVGTNDALSRVDLDTFSEALRDTVQWVKSHDIDIVLIDPLFTPSVADDEYYNALVLKVRDVAAQEAIPLVRRYEAMRFLSAGGGKDDDMHMLGRHFRLNDLGLRCMAEHVTRAITLSLLQPDSRPPGPGGKAQDSKPPEASAQSAEPAKTE